MSAFEQPYSTGMTERGAHRHGHIYRVNAAGAWRCTTHGRPLVEQDGVLVCLGCDLRIVVEPEA